MRNEVLESISFLCQNHNQFARKTNKTLHEIEIMTEFRHPKKSQTSQRLVLKIMAEMVAYWTNTA